MLWTSPDERASVYRIVLRTSTSASSPTHSLTTDHDRVFVAARRIALWRNGIQHRRRKAGHGNDRVWKAWKAMMPASHPSHTLWKSLRDSHTPTASTTGYMSFRAHSTRP